MTSLADLIADDFAVFDGAETVTLVDYDGAETSVAGVTSGPLSKNQAGSVAGLVAPEDETRSFSLPVASLGGVEPQQGYTLTDADDKDWMIKTAAKQTFSSRFLCACVALRGSAANTVPTISGPATAEVDQDSSVVLAAYVVSDAENEPVTIALAATHGAITLAATAGLTFAVGDGTTDAAMEFSGTLAAVNAALDGVTFTPTASYFGAASVELTAIDESGGESETKTTAVTVVKLAIDPPTISGPSSAAVVANNTDEPISESLTLNYEGEEDLILFVEQSTDGGESYETLAEIGPVSKAALQETYLDAYPYASGGTAPGPAVMYLRFSVKTDAEGAEYSTPHVVAIDIIPAAIGAAGSWSQSQDEFEVWHTYVVVGSHSLGYSIDSVEVEGWVGGAWEAAAGSPLTPSGIDQEVEFSGLPDNVRMRHVSAGVAPGEWTGYA